MFLDIIAAEPDIMALPKFSPLVESLRIVPVKPCATCRDISSIALSFKTVKARDSATPTAAPQAIDPRTSATQAVVAQATRLATTTAAPTTAVVTVATLHPLRTTQPRVPLVNVSIIFAKAPVIPT